MSELHTNQRPPFVVEVVELSSTDALLVALFGMTTKRSLQILGMNAKKMAVVDITLNPAVAHPRACMLWGPCCLPALERSMHACA